MAKRLIDLIRLAIPLKERQKIALDEVSRYLDNEERNHLKGLVKQRKVSFLESGLAASKQLIRSDKFYTLETNTTEKEIAAFVRKINERIKQQVKSRYQKEFSSTAKDIIPKYIALEIHGFDIIKKAIALQLFAKEPFHILLLGDPGTGKTVMLRNAATLHPISSFGLGSGTSGAGLSITVKGKEVTKGLLPMADKGLCAIDELNLMEIKDRASLYNAMEKGFVSYGKGGQHFSFDARVRVLATANPKGDRFAGWQLETLKKQLPFDPALLSRFHLIFLIKKPDTEQFLNIAKKILKSHDRKAPTKDEEFIREYVQKAEEIEVELPGIFSSQITDFVAHIKKDEDKYLVEVSPRLVIGFIRMAKASARMSMRSKVQQEDIDLVKEIISEGLKLKGK